MKTELKIVIVILLFALVVVVGVVAFRQGDGGARGSLEVYAVQRGVDSQGRSYSTYYLRWSGESTTITLSYIPFGTSTMNVYNGKTFSVTPKEPYPYFIRYDGKEMRLDP